MAQLVKTMAGLAIASVKTVNGLAIASVSTIAGLDNTSGGGPDVFYESIAPGSTNDYSQVANEGSFGMLGAPITAAQGGTITIVGVYFGFQNFVGQTVKIGLFTTSGTLLGTGSVNSTGVNDTWLDATLSVPYVASAGNYTVAYMVQSTTFGQGRCLTGQAAGSGVDNFTEVFATFPSGNLTFGNATTQQCVRLYMD